MSNPQNPQPVRKDFRVTLGADLASPATMEVTFMTALDDEDDALIQAAAQAREDMYRSPVEVRRADGTIVRFSASDLDDWWA